MTNIFIRANLWRTLLESRHRRRRLGIFILPLGAAVDAGDTPTHLAPSPLLKTVLVEVLTTRAFTPNDLLIGLHVEDTDGTLAIDGLANDFPVCGCLDHLGVKVRSAGDWSVCKYLL